MFFCSKCGRQLTNPESIALGIGPVCRMELKLEAYMHPSLNLFGGPDFTSSEIDGVTVIRDKNLGRMSVTNGVDLVLEDLRRHDPEALKRPIIYRDSEGVYDGILLTEGGAFAGFFSIGTPVLSDAIGKIKEEVANGRFVDAAG